MQRGKLYRSAGIRLTPNEVISEIDTDAGYKYLGILEADAMKSSKMKEIITTEYRKRVRTILKSKLNSKNVITSINSRAISLIRYSAGIIKWNNTELKNIDRKTRKLLSIYGMFHKKGDIDRLYWKRSEGGRGLISAEDCVEIEENNLYEYISKSEEEMLKAVLKESAIGKGKPKNDIINERKRAFSNKALHSIFQTKTEFKDVQSWQWLQKGDLKPATEGTIMAAQEQALRTKSIKHHIDKTDNSPLCRMCGEREETVAHIVSECSQLAQKQYKRWRHDVVA